MQITKIFSNITQSIDTQKLFGVSMLCNYLVYFFIFDLHYDHFFLSVIFRGIASFMCLPLIFMRYDESVPYKRLYWYITVTYCLPFFFAFMSFFNGLSTIWLMNSVSAMFFMLILFRLRLFVLLFLLGSSIGIVLYKYVFGYVVFFDPGLVTLQDIFATYFAVVVIGGLFAFNRDFIDTERKKHFLKVEELNTSLEDKVALRTAELKKTLQAKTEFLNNMSHEIRTPVQGFTVTSWGLVEYWEQFDNTKRLSLAKDIAKNAERLASLLNNLLDMSKFTADKMRMEFRQMDFNKLLLELIDECQALYIVLRQIIINHTTAVELGIVADPERIGQVLRNLLANAIKFSPEPSQIDVSVKIFNSSTYGAALHFTVKDQGMGIPEDELEEIFEPFTQSTRTKTAAGGTGFGLSICQQIIKAHHGKIWANNNLGAGASFHFIIPLTQEASGSSASIPVKAKEATILMIDDEEICLSTMELALFNSGYNLVTVIGGIAGLEYLQNHWQAIDVALLDLMMPDLSGLDLLAKMKQDPRMENIPVILQSGASDQEQINRAYEVGICGLIKKPYQREVVLAELEKVMKRMS